MGLHKRRQFRKVGNKMTIDKRMMTNFTLDALQNTSINQLVFEACMERVEYDSVFHEEDGKVLRLRDQADNELLEIRLDTDETYELRSRSKHIFTDTLEQSLVEGLYLDEGRIIPVVDRMVAQGVDYKLSREDYDGIELEYATTVGCYRHGCADMLDTYGATITGNNPDIDVHLRLEGCNWKGEVTNNTTNEVIGYDTPNLKSILEDITTLQSNVFERASQTHKENRRFNTPERFDAFIEEVQNHKAPEEPEWDFANEDNLER